MQIVAEVIDCVFDPDRQSRGVRVMGVARRQPAPNRLLNIVAEIREGVFPAVRNNVCHNTLLSLSRFAGTGV
jgi:hypothetical protein